LAVAPAPASSVRRGVDLEHHTNAPKACVFHYVGNIESGVPLSVRKGALTNGGGGG
jgi:hypothetical protein